MGCIFGKNKRPSVFPRLFYRPKSKKAVGAARVCCDAATWTEENHFYSARIGRTRRGSEPPAASLVLETSEREFGGEGGDSAAPPRAQHNEASFPVAAGDTRGAEVSQEPETKPHPEVMKHQELPEEAQGSQSPQESSEAEAVLHPPGSSLPPELGCRNQGVTPLAQIRVEVDVHMSAGDHGGLGQGQAAVKSELLSSAEQEAGAGSGAEQACVGRALWEVPVQKAGDSTATSCPLEEPELPLKAAEPGGGITNGQRAAEEQGGEKTEAPPDLQLGQGEIPAPEGVTETAAEPEQAEEMAKACGDGQTSEEIPACLLETQAALQEEEEEKIQVSSEGKPEEH
ncbi:uncharacterized protein [Aphelocoma coerulescens]|uniref:uncharacterized protein n=1 Tax=Aphelocoma coerulescens TaxID=39617 RepID=UPI0036048EB8